MSVMNDMLRSPPMTAHLTQTWPPRLAPMQGRPRSRTAPSTPLAEAPVTEYVELPGSMPFGDTNSHHRSQDDSSVPCDTRDPAAADALHFQNLLYGAPKVMGSATPRLSSSPVLHKHEESCRCNDCDQNDNFDIPHLRNATKTPYVVTARDGLSLNTQNPVYSPLSAGTLQSASLPPSLSLSRFTSTIVVPQTITPEHGQTANIRSHSHSRAGDATVDEFHHLRVTHEAHLRSLEQTHATELASLRSYVAVLESRQTPVGKHSRPRRHPSPTDDARHLHISVPHLEDSPTDDQAKCYRESRDQFQAMFTDSERATQRLRSTVRKAKDNERAMKNTIADLEARLVLSNNERTDILEGFHDACVKVRELSLLWGTSGCGTALLQLGPDVKELVAKANPPWLRIQHLRRIIKARDTRIEQLEEMIASGPETSWLYDRVSAAEASLEQTRQSLADARLTSERYNTLLHHELRRQSRATALTPQATPTKARPDRSNRTSARHGAEGSLAASQQVEQAMFMLEKELEHCINEIIVYK